MVGKFRRGKFQYGGFYGDKDTKKSVMEKNVTDARKMLDEDRVVIPILRDHLHVKTIGNKYCKPKGLKDAENV